MATSNSHASQKRFRKARSGSKPLAAASQPATAGDTGSLANPQLLRNLYALLLKCRLAEEQVQRLSAASAMAAAYDPAIGHEAVPVGAIADLGSKDTLVASPRNLAARIASGEALPELLAHPGPSQGCVYTTGAAPGVFLSDDPLNLGTGLALGCRLQKKQQVVVALACRAAPPDHCREAWKFADAHKLPIVYVIHGGSIAAGDAPHLEAISFMARDCGFPGIIVDGQDVVAVRRVAQESIHRARIGCGPTLLDCRTDAASDPLARLEHYMRKRRAWHDAWSHSLAAEIRAELEIAAGPRPASRL